MGVILPTHNILNETGTGVLVDNNPMILGIIEGGLVFFIAVVLSIIITLLVWAYFKGARGTVV